MLIVCQSISGKDIPEDQRFLGESADTNFSPLVVGGGYFVFALLFFANRVNYLIAPDDLAPMWAPSCLFSIADPRVSPSFYATAINKNSQFAWLHDTYRAQFIVGYQKITESFEHFVGILERNEADLIFFQNKGRFLLNSGFPQLPTMMTDVSIPAGTKMQASVANNILQGANGGGCGVQFQIQVIRGMEIPGRWFSNSRTLP